MFQYLVLTVFTVVTADYDCICNYNTDYAVYGQPADNSDTLGYLFEFDCKEKLSGSSNAKYTAIAFEHAVGYIITNDETQSQVCPGDPSPDDILTTTSIPMTTSRIMDSTTTIQMSTPFVPTDFTNSLPSTTATITTSQTPPQTTATTPTTSASTTTTPPTTSASTETSSTTKPPTTSASTTTAPTKSTSTETSSTAPTTAAGFMAMSTTSTLTGMYTDKPIPKGQINLCSTNLRNIARRNGYYIGQYNQTCYLLKPRVKSYWAAAESYCKLHGGTLFDISNVQEQEYIMSFLKSNNFQDEVWMGLNDKGHEERFTWISGEKLTYTNWYPYRKDDIDAHGVEDCAVLVPFAPFNGQWDDLHCGTFFGTQLHSHSYICQFRVHGSGQSYLGGLIG